MRLRNSDHMQPRTCEHCIQWKAETCRAAPPTALLDGVPVWPRTKATDWCMQFKSAHVSEGTPRKFSDEDVLDYLRNFDFPEEDERYASPRKQVVDFICEKFKVSSNPVMKRLEKLARAGMIEVGPDPWPEKQTVPTSGIHVWLGAITDTPPPEAGAPRKNSGRPEVITEEDVFEVLTRLAPTAAMACSLRSVHRTLSARTRVSLPTVHRKMKELVESGQALMVEGGGYCAGTPI